MKSKFVETLTSFLKYFIDDQIIRFLNALNISIWKTT